MIRPVKTMKHAVWVTIFISLFHSLMGEFLFYASLQDLPFMDNNNLSIVAIVITILYALPIVIFFQAGQLKVLLLMLISTPLLTVIVIFLHETLFPITKENFAGVLGFLIIGFNMIFVIFGTILGILIKILVEQRHHSNEDYSENNS
ncbi:hypothetical protein [Paenibacillus lemnae]|uniref:Uncharacterized protein n=1 Tax=Paenibacillus lemnae TaxID=1330551 RepID=A0A848MAB1_PAELE|nr:hypothetical protein [Paenibacillus lemnae]NMO97141.1 hypothetical protein [Paenibacillus lemnae]